MQEGFIFNDIELFAVLVYAFHKEPIEIADFDPLCIKNYFEFLKAVKKQLITQLKIYKAQWAETGGEADIDFFGDYNI